MSIPHWGEKLVDQFNKLKCQKEDNIYIPTEEDMDVWLKAFMVCMGLYVDDVINDVEGECQVDDEEKESDETSLTTKFDEDDIIPMNQ